MSMSKAKEKIIRYNVKTRATYQIYSEESQERTLKTLSRSRLLEKDNIELKNMALEIAKIYFSDGISSLEFKRKVFRDYPKYEDNYTFNIFLDQGYRELYRIWLQKQENSKKLLKKLALVYRERRHGDK